MTTTRASLILLFLTCNYNIQAEQLIILTFRPYPISEESTSANQFAKNLKQPGKIAYNKLRSFLEGGNVVSGIFCTYAGFLSISNRYGQVRFPKLQTKAKFHLLITTRLIPILLIENTIHHWEIEPQAPTKLFIVEQTYDTKTETLMWNTQEVPISSSLRNQTEIPLDTIIILAEPKHIFVPLGTTTEEGTYSPHFILPPLYIRKGIDKIDNSLYILNLKYFFKTLRNVYQVYPSGFSSLLDYY